MNAEHSRTGVPAFTAGVVSIKLISLIISGRYSRVAGAKILDYYKSVITGPDRGGAPSFGVDRRHRWVLYDR